MLLDLSRPDVVSGGLEEVTAFQFEMNAVAFRAAIDGIYADKIMAPLREYCTNAYDAHIAAGKKDRPFDVHLPSLFDLTFRVRDYGVGLTHQQVMRHYTVMFGSSKRESNDMVGALGLGCKSAFAYTSVFTVTAWDGREKRIYSAFLGDAGVPQMSLIATLDSDEPVGVEVSFPVKQEDVPKFSKAATKVFLGFNPKPNVVNETFDVPEPIYVRPGVEYHSPSVLSGAHARQGCVIYPISTEAMGETQWASEIFKLARLPVIIDFPIGELSVATSREALGYDPRTIANLKKRLNEIIPVLEAIPAEEVAKTPTWIEACKLLGSARAYSTPTHALWTYRSASSGLKHSGREVITNIGLTQTAHSSQFRLIEENRVAISFRPDSLYVETGNYARYIFVVQRDLNLKFPVMRIRQVREQHPGKHVAWIKAGPDIDAVLEKLGDPKVIELDNVTLPVKQRGVAIKREVTTTAGLRWLNKNGYVKQEVDVDFTQGGFYVRTDGSDYRLSYGRVGSYDIGRLITAAIDLGILSQTDKVIALTQRWQTIPKRFKGWVDIQEHLRDHLLARLDPKAFAEAKALDSIFSDPFVKFLQKYREHLPARFKGFMASLDKLAPTRPSVETAKLFDLYRKFIEPSFENSSAPEKLLKQLEQLREKSPVLVVIATSHAPFSVQEAAAKSYLKIPTTE